MKVVGKDTDCTYIKLENVLDLDKFVVPMGDSSKGGGFYFFRGLGIKDYKSTFKAWLRQFPRPIFIIAAKGNTMVSWVYIDVWSDRALDGEPVYVLRAIETLPSLRGRKVGFKVTLYALKEVVGYTIVKPLTREAARFFKKMGFMEPEEFRKCPIDLTQHHGYLILPPYRREMLLNSYRHVISGY